MYVALVPKLSQVRLLYERATKKSERSTTYAKKARSNVPGPWARVSPGKLQHGQQGPYGAAGKNSFFRTVGSQFEFSDIMKIFEQFFSSGRGGMGGIGGLGWYGGIGGMNGFGGNNLIALAAVRGKTTRKWHNCRLATGRLLTIANDRDFHEQKPL